MKKISICFALSLFLAGNSYCSDLSKWMGELSSSLPGFSNMKLTEIAIPGSHDSLTSDIKQEKRAGGALNIVGKIPLVNKTILNLSKAQGDDIINQFKNGSRYFDIRIAETNKGFEGVHGFYNGPIEKSFRDLRTFLDSKPTEIVLLDFQHVDAKDQTSLFKMINDIFSDLIYRPSAPLTATYGEIVQSGKRVVIFYDKNGIGQDTQNTAYPRNKFLVSKWHNQTSPEKINEAILKDAKDRPRDFSKINVIQAQTTPDVKSFIKGIVKAFIPFTSKSSLKKDAQKSGAAQADLLQSASNDKLLLDAINVFMVDYLNAEKSRNIIALNKEKISKK